MKKILYSMVALVVAAFTMTSCEDVPMPYDRPGTGGNGGGETIVVEPAGTGTATDPFNVSGAIAYTQSLGADVTSDKEIYIKGVVLENSTTEATIKSYGNMTFTIVDAGTKKPVFTAFQVYGPGKKKFAAVSDIKPGQEVVVCGKVINFRGKTPETVGKGASYVVSINGEGGSSGGETTPGDAKGDGTQANPYNVAGIIAFTKALAPNKNSEKQVYFTGTVDSFKSGEEPGNTYGNATFYLKDESTTEKFYCFRVMGPDNKKFTSADQLKVGDKVVVYGNVVNYNGNTPETVLGKAYVVSINGGGGSTGGGTTEPAEGISINGTTVTLTNTKVTAGTETVTCVVNDLGIADKGAAAGTYNLSDGSTLTVAQGEGSSAPTYYKLSKGFRLYANNTLSFHGKKKIAKIEITCDSYNGTNYVGNPTATVTFNGQDAIYCNKLDGSKGGVQLRAQKMIITYAAE